MPESEVSPQHRRLGVRRYRRERTEAEAQARRRSYMMTALIVAVNVVGVGTIELLRVDAMRNAQQQRAVIDRKIDGLAKICRK